MTATSLARPPRNIAAPMTLFFVAPLVAEFLLGNLSLKLLPALVVLAPFYGGGAILIRETAFTHSSQPPWPADRVRSPAAATSSSSR